MFNMEAKLILRQGTSPFTENYRYKIQDGKYGRMEEVKDEAGDKVLKFIPYGMSILVKEILISMETAEKHLVLQVPDSHGNITEVKMPREYLTEQKITDLVKYGAQVNKKSASILLQCLENLEQKAPLLYQHTKTGFSMVGSVQVFKGFHLYCNDKQFNSTYAGSLKIAPQGSFEAWTRMVNQEVLGSKLEVILASALSAVTFDFVHDIFPTENLIISLYGGSSTGKSTALNLAVSTGALPTTTEDSLLLTFLDTENSLMRRMVSGFPIGIDEATTLKKDITRLLYAIANGKERSRLTKNLDIAEASEFHTTIFTSSEISIFSLADNNEGLQVRVIELSETWTKDSDSSDEIKRITKSNYGFAIPLLAKYLLKLGTVKVAERCSLWTKRFLECNQTKKVNALYGRLAKKIGIICATAELAEYALGIKFDTTSLMKYFSEQLLSTPESFDCGIQAHNAIIDYVTAHPEDFGKNIPLKESDIYKKNGYFGQASIKTLYDGSTSSTVLHIKKEVFEMILDKNKFRDPKIVLKRLKELGVLVSDKDRYISKFTVAKDGENILVRGYRLYVPNDETPINDEGVTTDGQKMTAHRHRRDSEQEKLIKPVRKKRNIGKLRRQAEEKWEEYINDRNI